MADFVLLWHSGLAADELLDNGHVQVFQGLGHFLYVLVLTFDEVVAWEWGKKVERLHA